MAEIRKYAQEFREPAMQVSQKEWPSTPPLQASKREGGLGWWLVSIVVLLLHLTSLARADDLGHPLSPPDRSSPRATLNTFLQSCDAVGAFVAGGYMSAPTRDGFHRLQELVSIPVGCLDLSETGAALRPKIGTRAAVDIYEILCRLQLPPYEEIPGAVPPGVSGAAESSRWIIPNTEIALVRGPTGEFLFCADTVARAEGFYERVQDLPYVRSVPKQDLRDLSIEGGGWLVPYSWVRSMPQWLRSPIAGESAWKWISLATILLVAAVLTRYSFLLSRRGSRERPLRQAVVRLTLPAFVLIATPVIEYLALVQVSLVGSVGTWVMLATTVVLHLVGAWVLWRIAPIVGEAVIAWPRVPTDGMDAHLIRIFARLFGSVASVGLLALGADRLGVPMYGILAGLGVGGLALALAAQPTIENLIGGLSLFADKPMRVGDVGKFDSVVGTVEGIGIRSTRIRGMDRTLTTIPNAALAKSCIVNFTVRDKMLIQTVIGLRYETSPEQLRFILAKLQEMLLAHPRMLPESVRVRFVEFGASTLDVELFGFAATTDWAEFLGIREDVFLRVMEVVEQGGSSFAFPSQMHYEARENGLDGEKARAAEREVVKWREENRLPFPRFVPEDARKIHGTLDCPPSGSSKA